MKGRRKKLCAGLGLMLILLLIQPLPVRAEETTHPQTSDERTQQAEDADRITDDLTDELIGELELDEMERFLAYKETECPYFQYGDDYSIVKHQM